MRKLIVVVFVVFFILVGSLVYSASLEVEISKIKYISGKLFVGLSRDAGIFPRVRSAYKWLELKVDKDKLVCDFKGIPGGLYAISTFHDVNNNRRFDRHPIGIPKEPFGFSNNVLGFMGPPSFMAASFKVYEDEVKKIGIELKEAL